MAIKIMAVGVLMIISFYDIRYGLIYDRLVILLALLSLYPLFAGDISWENALLGSIMGSSLLEALRYLSRGGLGFGDVKFVAALGLWLGIENILLCLLLASMLGVLYGVGMLLGRRMQRNTPIPFGPFLALGALLAWSEGSRISNVIGEWLWW